MHLQHGCETYAYFLPAVPPEKTFFSFLFFVGNLFSLAWVG